MKHIHAFLGLVAVPVVVIAACSGHTFSTGSDAGGGGGGDSGLSSSCPSSAPAGGASCSTVGLECEYGGDPHIDCDTIARCDATGWTVTPPGSVCPTPEPSSCPATYAAVPQGSTCTTAASCAYQQGDCSCEVYCGPQYPVGHTCEAGTPMTWQCTGPNQGCPSARPRVGSDCSMEGQQCDYGDCNSIGLVCHSGTWHTQQNGCPVSARRFKEGIHYLDDEELRALAGETLDTRLATYSYKIGDPGTRLGFIIDDRPGSPAVAAGKERVDLYAYTSMAVATLQVQSREIDELRREVRDLQARVDACGR